MFLERFELVSSIRLSIGTIKNVPKVLVKYVSFFRHFFNYLCSILFSAEMD